MATTIGEKRILRSALEPPNTNWLWLKTVNGTPVLHEYLSGKWVPFSGTGTIHPDSNILGAVFGGVGYNDSTKAIEFYSADGKMRIIGSVDVTKFSGNGKASTLYDSVNERLIFLNDNNVRVVGERLIIS